jgi:hypothetical protein
MLTRSGGAMKRSRSSSKDDDPAWVPGSNAKRTRKHDSKKEDAKKETRPLCIITIEKDANDPKKMTIYSQGHNGEVEMIQAILAAFKINLGDVKSVQDTKDHPGCNFGCKDFWNAEGYQLMTRDSTELYDRPNCEHRFHRFCLTAHYFWSTICARGNDRDGRALFDIQCHDSWTVPIDFCPVCLASKRRNMISMIPANRIKYLMFPIELGTIISRPHFSKRHLEELKDKCKVGDLLDLEGYRFRDAVGLDANRVWVGMQSEDDVALIPRDFWEVHGKEYYAELCEKAFWVDARCVDKASKDWLMHFVV